MSSHLFNLCHLSIKFGICVKGEEGKPYDLHNLNAHHMKNKRMGRPGRETKRKI